jgi:hypothetical protein
MVFMMASAQARLRTNDGPLTGQEPRQSASIAGPPVSATWSPLSAASPGSTRTVLPSVTSNDWSPYSAPWSIPFDEEQHRGFHGHEPPQGWSIADTARLRTPPHKLSQRSAQRVPGPFGRDQK